MFVEGTSCHRHIPQCLQHHGLSLVVIVVIDGHGVFLKRDLLGNAIVSQSSGQDKVNFLRHDVDKLTGLTCTKRTEKGILYSQLV